MQGVKYDLKRVGKIADAWRNILHLGSVYFTWHRSCCWIADFSRSLFEQKDIYVATTTFDTYDIQASKVINGNHSLNHPLLCWRWLRRSISFVYHECIPMFTLALRQLSLVLNQLRKITNRSCWQLRWGSRTLGTDSVHCLICTNGLYSGSVQFFRNLPH